MAKSKKQIVTQSPLEPEYKVGKGFVSEPEYAKTTPQNFATNVLGFYEERITKALNKFSDRQDDPELVRLYISYRQLLEVSRKSAKKYLKKDLPDLPILTKSNCYVGMINLADYCKNCATILMGKTGISNGEQKKPAGTGAENKGLKRPNSKVPKIFGDKIEICGLPINYKNLWCKIKNWPCVKKLKSIRNFGGNPSDRPRG